MSNIREVEGRQYADCRSFFKKDFGDEPLTDPPPKHSMLTSTADHCCRAAALPAMMFVMATMSPMPTWPSPFTSARATTLLSVVMPP